MKSGLGNPVGREVDYRTGILVKLTYISAMSREIARRENISRARILWEIFILYGTCRLGPLLYFEARLWRRDWSLRRKMGFMNAAQYRKRIAELNPPEYQKFSQHKLVEKSILTSLGTPTPTFFGFLHPVEGCTVNFDPLTDDRQLHDLLQSLNTRRVCFKLCEGWGGSGFIAAELSTIDGDLRLQNMELRNGFHDAEAFFEKFLRAGYTDGLIIEEYIEQHQILAALNNSSVNTLRFWVRERGDSAEVIGAILRIGREGQLVDNASRGGFISIVDLETGILGCLMTPKIIPESATHHPDSNERVEGLTLPYWQESLDLARRTLMVFPRATFAGLDIAVSSEGPMILELNLQPDKISARNFGATTAELLS